MNDAAPDHVSALARRRSDARRSGDFGTADALRAEIEQAGWKVVDEGHEFRLERARPPDREIDGRVYYGASESVPSRLTEAVTAQATVVITAGREPARLERSVSALRRASPEAQLVVVGDDPGSAPMAVLDGVERDAEVVRLASPGTLGRMWNAGLRRAAGSVVVLVAQDSEFGGDIVSGPLAALADENVALVGAAGLVSRDLRRWLPAGAGEADALDAVLLAFRRDDVLRRGSLDERFATPRWLAIWWSLHLRDAGAGQPPRLARALALPVSTASGTESEERDRPARRDFYRLIDLFGRRYDLLRESVTPTAAERPGRPR